MTFINHLEHELNKSAYTENGALSYKSTLSPVLDFFSKSGALRGKKEEALELFYKGFNEPQNENENCISSKTLMKRALFYMRDIRKGQGERDLFRYIIHDMAINYSDETRNLIMLIPIFGRWDDLYSFVDTPLENEAFEFMKIQFEDDLNKINEIEKNVNKNQDLDFKNLHISLIGKWLKSINTSSKESRKLGGITRKHFKMSAKRYRKELSKLRNVIDVVECKMCKNKWEDINFEKISSNAMKKYIKAFKKHLEKEYNEYLQSVKEGKVKIHSDTLYPYDIIREYTKDISNVCETLELQWKNLPNYFETNENSNSICVVDTSGSMYSSKNFIKPIDVAISLGIYIAERNIGSFKDSFITFSRVPELQQIKGETLKDKILNIKNSDWGMNTDLIEVFKLILSTTKKYNIPENEQIKKIFVISDMQFDSAYVKYNNNNKTIFEIIDEMFKKEGIKRPELIFWNVNAHANSPVEKDKQGAYLVSGASPSILQHALNINEQTAMDLMLETLNSKRYAIIN